MSTIERGYNLPTDNFTLVPNAWVRDNRLSRRARGLLIELMSHKAGWKTSVATLAKVGPEGESAVKSAIKELETVGYLTRHATTDARGRRTGTKYVITDPGQKEQPSSEPSGENHPMDDEPSGENHLKESSETGDQPLGDFPPVAGDPPKKNTLQEEHLQEDLQEENHRRRVLEETHHRALNDCEKTAAAAITHLEQMKIKELVNELRLHGLTASFRKLDNSGRAEILGLINRCGSKQLVTAAKQMHQPDSPARFVQAWLPTWRELPATADGPKPYCGKCVTGWIENEDRDLVARCECRGAA